jgi:hypothetical protein
MIAIALTEAAYKALKATLPMADGSASPAPTVTSEPGTVVGELGRLHGGRAGATAT